MALVREGAVVHTAAEVIAASPGTLVVRHEWRGPNSPKACESYQVLRLRGGRVVAMRDHRHRRSALRSVTTPA